MNFKGTEISAIILHAFFIQQAAMLACGSIEDHMFDFLTEFLPH